MRSYLKLSLAVAAVLAVPAALMALDARPFSIQLTTSADGIAAGCLSGCAWTTLSANYPGGQYRITERGVFAVGAGPAERGEFSFVLNASERGFAARCEAGCEWKELSATDSRGTFLLTEMGVRAGSAVE